MLKACGFCSERHVGKYPVVFKWESVPYKLRRNEISDVAVSMQKLHWNTGCALAPLNGANQSLDMR